jgi:hypothetical protein
MTLKIPDALATKANRFPESSYGATTVTLILSGGRWIHDVILGGAEYIVKVKGRSVSDAADLGFSVSDIVDVCPNRSLKVIPTVVLHWARRWRALSNGAGR